MTDNTISLTPDAQGDNFKGHVSIPNPSVLTLEIVRVCNFSEKNQ